VSDNPKLWGTNVTLRDLVAGMCATVGYYLARSQSGCSYTRVAQEAYALADALLAERERQRP
jgi:hypothetical protein